MLFLRWPNQHTTPLSKTEKLAIRVAYLGKHILIADVNPVLALLEPLSGLLAPCNPAQADNMRPGIFLLSIPGQGGRPARFVDDVSA